MLSRTKTSSSTRSNVSSEGGFWKQTWTLTLKNLMIVFVRHWLSTTLRAVVLPIVFMFFISYAKNLFVPPSVFGVGTASPVRSLPEAFGAAASFRNKVVFVNNGHTQGDIQRLINELSTTIQMAGKTVQVVQTDLDVIEACPSSLRGVSSCYGAASFYSSPTEGTSGLWNYTLRADGYLATKIYVNENTNDQELYTIPLQHAIDSAIASIDGLTLPALVDEFPFTRLTQEQRAQAITRAYQGTIINILAVAFYLAIVGITYQQVGQMASERELGMSQLIEAMMPNRRRWQPQAARLLANHLAFDIIFLPSWIINGVIIAYLVFPDANIAILIFEHLFIGLSLASFNLLFGSFFKRAQLSGITTTIVTIVLAIIAQLGVGKNGSSGAIIVLSALFPPMNYIFFIINCARFQRLGLAVNLTQNEPSGHWHFPGIVFWALMWAQIVIFPILGALVERSLYGTASSSRIMREDLDDSTSPVKLTAFSKHYRASWFKRTFRRRANPPFIAVNQLSLEVLHGEIMTLLGANGCGKSTTLEAITGLNTITEGTIEVDGTGGIGLCPQKNVLWDDLTVYEHVWIFNNLKAPKHHDSKQDIETLIGACDLAIKTGSRSETLSGGQKRKLQLAMMFTGGSRVCCVDEVSSGIDPLARRKVWDILLAERGKRTILLTTHFLDEADVLSDHIAIMSRGHLKAEGTTVELKHKLGSGLRVNVFDTSYLPGKEFAGVPRVADYDQTVYNLANSAETARFIAELEVNGITDYQVHDTTIEEIFLKLAEETRLELEAASPPNSSTPLVGVTDKQMNTEVVSDTASTTKPLELLPGHGTGLFRQSVVLLQKRFIVLRRNYLPYFAAIIIPIVAAGLVTRFLKNFNALSCNPGDNASIEAVASLTAFAPDLVYGPYNAALERLFTALYPALNSSTIHSVNSLAEFNSYIGSHQANVTPGGFFLGSPPTFAYSANYDVAQSVLTQNLLDNVLLNGNIVTGFSDFSVPFAPGAGDTLQLILYFGLAMSAYPGFFALYVTAERLRKVRALHYSNGVRAAPLWIAYVFFDFLWVLLISLIAIILFTAAWSGWYYPGYLFTVFFLYGLTSIAYSYVISLFVPSQLAAFAFAAGSQAVLFLLYFISYLCIITYAPANAIDSDIKIAHFTISLITPAGSMLRALLLSLNEFSITCDGYALAPYPGSITVYGGPILYLIVQFFLLMAFLIWYDSGGRIAFRKKHVRSQDLEEIEALDPELTDELSRVQSSNDGLRVLNLSKAFGANQAVDNVTYGIRKGEVFALLGPNGAGKSTTISLVRGDIRADSGEVFIDGTSLNKHRVAARNHLGVCPQFDAMDQMTVVEHLRLYARVRGVPDIKHNVTAVMHAVGLNTYANRLAAKLSGGNKRKLSLAIALMGNPSVLLLDEPSSGMDAAAKRVMWRVLGSVTHGRALLITTHSMEEADALAQRAGIMARRMLALGTTAALRKKHGAAYYVHLIHAQAPHTSANEMERVRQWVLTNVPDAVTEDRTYHGQLRFSVPTSSRLGISGLFNLMEANKEELGFAYYSVSPTTLDQVFLNVVNKHNVEEENYHAKEVKKARKGLVAKMLGR